MQFRYETSKLERECTVLNAMKRAYGQEISKALRRRIAEIRAAVTIDDLFLGAGKWERLSANRAGTLSARLTKNWRLIVPEDPADSILVIEIVDTTRGR